MMQLRSVEPPGLSLAAKTKYQLAGTPLEKSHQYTHLYSPFDIHVLIVVLDI